MSWQGDFAPGTTVNFTFTTVNTSGAPTQLSGTPVSRVFQNSLSSSAAAGVTLVSSFASTTGLNSIAIDTSQDTVFYAAGNNYSVVLTAGNVGGTSIVGYTVATFSLNNRSIRANVVSWSSATVSVPATAGIPDVSVKNMQNGTITTAAFAAAAMTTATFASGFFTAALLDATAGNAIADDLLDRANAIETGVTPRQAWRYTAAGEAGTTSGALTTTFTINAIANNATPRIQATTTASGNRTAVTLM